MRFIFAKGKDFRWAQWSCAADPFQSFKKWVTTLLGRGALKRCFAETFVVAQCFFFQELEEYYIPKIVYISDFSTRAMIISPWYSLMTQFFYSYMKINGWMIHTFNEDKNAFLLIPLKLKQAISCNPMQRRTWVSIWYMFVCFPDVEC